MNHINPTFRWYSKISEAKGILPRCPFRSVYRCSKYYLSRSLLGAAGSTKIDEDEDKGLLKTWRKSEFWPTTDEERPVIAMVSGESRSYDNFCPEVLFDRFGYFTSHLWRYPGENETGFAHERLAKEEASPDDSRWYWGGITPMHYTECPLFSLLSYKETQSATQNGFHKANNEILEIKPSVYGISLNPKALITRFARWWLKKSA